MEGKILSWFWISNSSAPALSTLESVCCCCFFSFKFYIWAQCYSIVLGEWEWVDCHSHNKGWDDVEIATVTFFIKWFPLSLFLSVALYACVCMLINGLCRFLLLSLMRMDNDYMMIIMWRGRNICNSSNQMRGALLPSALFIDLRSHAFAQRVCSM